MKKRLKVWVYILFIDLTKEIEDLEKLLETKKKAKKETKEAYESVVRDITNIRESFKPDYEALEEDK